jgi:hypothetical protein
MNYIGFRLNHLCNSNPNFNHRKHSSVSVQNTMILLLKEITKKVEVNDLQFDIIIINWQRREFQ